MDLRFRYDSHCVRGKPYDTRRPRSSRKTQKSAPIVDDVDVMMVGGASTESQGCVAQGAGRQADADAIRVEANDLSLLSGGEEAPITAESEVVRLQGRCVNFRRAGRAV